LSGPVPAKGRPQRLVLTGRYAQLEPIGEQHAAQLFDAAGAERYAYLFNDRPSDVAAMGERLRIAARQDDPLGFAVIDLATGRAEGQQSLMRVTPEHGVIEIGAINWGDAIARTRITTEALYLHARYVFETLGYRRFEWKCNALNAPSRSAALRFGFSFEGIFRQHMIVKGQSRDTAWFAMLDAEWPLRRDGYERWLAPENFDAHGQQRAPLRFAVERRA
jgi:RimJ/RimL family protein N-acetyltransferase